MLRGEAGKMEKAAKLASKALNGLWARYKCGNMNASTMRRNPNLAVMRGVLVDGNSNLKYPKLVEAVEEGSDESM